jgi:type III restriction enzyme
LKSTASAERDNANAAFLTLTEITPPPRITAKVRTRVTDRSGTRDAEVVLRQGEDLAQKTGRSEHHGFVVENIDFGAGFLEFENGERLYLLVGMVPSRPSVFREQIRQTIRRHMQWQMEVAEHDIKVLSLFY